MPPCDAQPRSVCAAFLMLRDAASPRPIDGGTIAKRAAKAKLRHAIVTHAYRNHPGACNLAAFCVFQT